MPRSDLILLDCDDVLLDFLPGFLGHARARGLDPDPAGPGQFNMAPWLGLSSADMIALIREFNEGEGTGFDTLDPIPGAVEGVRALRDAGYRLRVVSSFSDCPGAHSRRALNLERAFGADAFEGLDATPLGASKSEILARHAPSPMSTIFCAMPARPMRSAMPRSSCAPITTPPTSPPPRRTARSDAWRTGMICWPLSMSGRPRRAFPWITRFRIPPACRSTCEFFVT